jgi:16S rRNA (uracil1498-N3)-methyltransferase
MSDRFFISPPVDGAAVTLTGPEAHHLAHVLRAKAGDTVSLFDGSGREFMARINSIKKHAIELTIEEQRMVNRESTVSLALAVALPKGERQRWLIEKVVELGVARLVPLVTNRGVAQPVDAALVRLRRAVVEASKQCGRNRLMEIAEPCRIDDLILNTPSSQLRLIAHPGGQPLREIWPLSESAGAIHQMVAAVGPEGGFTDEEAAIAKNAGWITASLGLRILRIETAAIAIAAWASLGETQPSATPHTAN